MPAHAPSGSGFAIPAFSGCLLCAVKDGALVGASH